MRVDKGMVETLVGGKVLAVAGGNARLQDDRDAAVEIARELVRMGADLSSMKGEAWTWLTAPEYAPLR